MVLSFILLSLVLASVTKKSIVSAVEAKAQNSPHLCDESLETCDSNVLLQSHVVTSIGLADVRTKNPTHISQAVFYTMEAGSGLCPEDQRITSLAECYMAMADLGLAIGGHQNKGNFGFSDRNVPGGCSWRNDGMMHFNMIEPGTTTNCEDDPQHINCRLMPVCKAVFFTMEAGSCCCPEDQRVTSVTECYAAMNALGLAIGGHQNKGNFGFSDQGVPGGCSWRNDGMMHFNMVEPGSAKNCDDDPQHINCRLEPVCKAAASLPKITFFTMEAGSCCCPEDKRITALTECYTAMNALGLAIGGHQNKGNFGFSDHNVPGGCSWRNDGMMHFNMVEPGSAKNCDDDPQHINCRLMPVCKE